MKSEPLSALQFNQLKQFLLTAEPLPLGFNQSEEMEAHKALLAERLGPKGRMQSVLPEATSSERLLACSDKYVPQLIHFLRENRIFSKVFNSTGVRQEFEANTSVTAIKELTTIFKDLDRGHKVLVKLCENYTQASDLSAQDIVDLRMLDYTLGTLRSVCRGLQDDKEKVGQYDEAEAIGVTMSGIKKFQNEIKKAIPPLHRGLM